MRLGRRPCDPAAVASAPRLDSHRFAAVMPPASLDRGAAFTPGMYGNDTLPDCTAAALANSARSSFVMFAGTDLAVDQDKVPAFYAECVGLTAAATVAEMEATDGAVMLDVMMRQARHGFDVGPQLLAAVFGTLPVRRTVLASAMAHLGHADIGVTLYEADMTLPPAWSTGYAPGKPVGGHAVMLLDYEGLGDSDTVRVGTWGAWQRATWAWLEARTDEAYALVWRQLLGVDPPVDADMLEAQLQRFMTA